MNTLLNIQAAEISSWSVQPDAKAKLPEVIRRLVLATAPRLALIDFPSGSRVYEAGWDGITEAIVGSAFVPEGTTGWEIGTSPVTNTKAKTDYDKRTAKPLNLTPNATTFVLVTSQDWPTPAKRQFIADRQAEKVWKEVRAYDANDLEAWLATAPAVQYWFARLLGKRPANVTDLETYWLDWAAETMPPTPAALLTLGRQNAVAEIHSWLKGAENILGIQTDSHAEALAMFAAAVQELPENEQLTYFARCVVVHSVEAWRELVASQASLLLVPLFDDHSVISGALRQGHRVMVPLDRTETSRRGKVIELPRLPRLEVSALLRTLAITEDRADALAGIARRSFAAFRRALIEYPIATEPEWVYTEHQDILIAALLVGTWDEEKEDDKTIVAQVAGTAEYSQVKSCLVNWLAVPDPPVRLVGSVWFIIDKGDVWSLLASRITSEQLERFTQAALRVLSGIPPRYDLPREEWYRAELLGKKSPYSSKLRESLATTLAFLGSLEDPLPIAGAPASQLADRLVTELLRVANIDWRIWSALSSNLRWLAEAAPGPFIQGVQDGLRGEAPVMKLFEASEDFFGPSTDYPGLLWALETLAWSPDHLLPVTLLLGELSRRAPSPPLVNRPINSLREIFLLWYPHTAASLDQRLRVLDELQRRESAVSGELLRNLSPKSHSVSSGTNKPRWRDWVPARNITRREVYEATLAIQERLLRQAQQDISRWEAIILDFPEVPYEQQAVVLTQLRELSQEITNDADRVRLRDKLRELVSRHRSYAKQDWAMLPARVDELAEVMDLFEPNDFVLKYLWLFADWVLLPEGREDDDHNIYQGLVAERQQQALQLLYEHGGLDTITSLIPLVGSSQALGRLVGQSDLLTEAQSLTLIDKYLKSITDTEAAFAFGLGCALADKHAGAERYEWVESALATYKNAWPAIKQAEWLRLLPSVPRTWQAVSELASEGQEYYWQLLPYFFVEDEDTEQGAKFFLAHNHVTKAVELLGQRMYQDKPVSTELATEALERMLRERPSPLPSSHKIDTILEKLAEAADADRERVIKLEFALLPDSYSSRKSKQNRLIYKELDVNPSLFADLISRVYRAQGTEPRELSEEESDMSLASWRLLGAWRTVPGLDETGHINQHHLVAWVARVRELLATNGRQVIGDEQIGQLLSGSPVGTDGAWPHEAVRALLEEVASLDIERGFMIGRFNSRGTTSRGPYDGGEQERVLVKEYLGYAEKVKDTSYRTAEILRKMAQRYERDAIQEDNEASLNQDLHQ